MEVVLIEKIDRKNTLLKFILGRRNAVFVDEECYITRHYEKIIRYRKIDKFYSDRNVTLSKLLIPYFSKKRVTFYTIWYPIPADCLKKISKCFEHDGFTDISMLYSKKTISRELTLLIRDEKSYLHIATESIDRTSDICDYMLSIAKETEQSLLFLADVI